MTSANQPSKELKAPIIAGFVASISGSAATFGIAIAGLLAMGATRANLYSNLCFANLLRTVINCT